MAFFAYLLLREYFLQLRGCQWLVWLVAPPPVFVVNPQSDWNKAEIRASRTRLFLQGAHSDLSKRGYARRTLGVWRSARISTGLWQLQQTRSRAEPCP